MIKNRIDSFMINRCEAVPADRAPQLYEMGYQAFVAGSLATRIYFGTGEAAFALNSEGKLIERTNPAPEQHRSDVYVVEKPGFLGLGATESKLS